MLLFNKDTFFNCNSIKNIKSNIKCIYDVIFKMFFQKIQEQKINLYHGFHKNVK